MYEPPQLLRPTRHTSGGQSPTRQRLSDDILAYLTPATAVDALATATGPLGDCLAAASAAEREFAMQCAVASRNIWDWVDELQEWPWPREGGSTGFDEPSERERDPFAQGGRLSERYLGSLRAGDVARYEMRVEDIHHELEELAIEDIKSHVLTNHIMPLSRPTTPLSDYRSSHSTVSNYNKMEDLTAVVTAIVVQTLPNLAKLSRLLQDWNVRLSVLQQIPVLLSAIEKAEHTLRSGWSAINTPTGQAGAEVKSSMTRADFNIMKSVIESTLVVPGRHLDFMLDRLEGYLDTLPDGWLDRVEVLERGYADWVAACEHNIRSADWTRSSRSQSDPLAPSEGVHEDMSVSNQSKGLPIVSPDGDPAITLPVPVRETASREPSKRGRGATKKLKAANIPHVITTTDGTSDRVAPTTRASKSRTAKPTSHAHLPRVDTLQLPRVVEGDSPRTPEDMLGLSEEEELELELPPLRDGNRRDSVSSQTSTVLHGASSQFDMSSDLPEVSASPYISNLRVRQAQYDRSTESPPSSPPLHEADSRETSLISEHPTEVGRDDDDSTLPRTPIEGSFSESFFEDSFTGSEVASPSWQQQQSERSRDQHMQKQITEILENIPAAKIKLTKEPPNLNPPDLQLPKLRSRPSKEPFKRSISSLSQRTSTPSFTLSPAKNSRPRSRTQQNAKVYHLARSTGEAPIKLLIRCVGENGERVMVRVGGGWADLSEYLKEYASHHGRRSAGAEKAKVEVRDVRRVSGRESEARSSPPSRPASALDTPMTPLAIRKTRRESEAAKRRAGTPLPTRIPDGMEPGSEERGMRSRSNSRLSWVEDDSSFLGLAGPSGKKVEMSEENKAWVESVKEKVRMVSGERRVPSLPLPLPLQQQQQTQNQHQYQPQQRQRAQTPDDYNKNKFGELGKVGGTKRLFRKAEGQAGQKDVKKKD